MNAGDETNITDIELLPDGRICIFGTSREVLEVLNSLQCGMDAAVKSRLNSQSDVLEQPQGGIPFTLRAHYG